ncbi:unnamed protein product, partial [Brassica rapa subsp. trilocularis]
GVFRTKGDKKVHPETPKSILSTLLYLLCFMKICVLCLIRTILDQTVLRKFI